MKTNFGFKIKRKSNYKNGESLHLVMKCYSCSKGGTGGFDGKRWWCDSGCDGFLRAVNEHMAVVECDGYKEQKFKIPKKLKKQLREWITEYCIQTIEGKHNITQQSDSWFEMEYCTYAGILYMLQHRKSLNELKRIGKRHVESFKSTSLEEIDKKV